MAEPEVVPPLEGPTGPSRRHIVLLVVAAIPALVVIATVVELVLRIQTGPLAFFGAFEQWFFLGLVVLVPVAVLRDARVLRAALAIALVAGVVRFGGEWLSLSPAARSASRRAIIASSGRRSRSRRERFPRWSMGSMKGRCGR